MIYYIKIQLGSKKKKKKKKRDTVGYTDLPQGQQCEFIYNLLVINSNSLSSSVHSCWHTFYCLPLSALAAAEVHLQTTARYTTKVVVPHFIAPTLHQMKLGWLTRRSRAHRDHTHQQDNSNQHEASHLESHTGWTECSKFFRKYCDCQLSGV